MWRPDNWEEIKLRSTTNPDDPELKRDRVLAYNCGYEWGVEAGADAMLKALRKSGLPVSKGEIFRMSRCQPEEQIPNYALPHSHTRIESKTSGVWTFIPEK